MRVLTLRARSEMGGEQLKEFRKLKYIWYWYNANMAQRKKKRRAIQRRKVIGYLGRVINGRNVTMNVTKGLKKK